MKKILTILILTCCVSAFAKDELSVLESIDGKMDVFITYFDQIIFLLQTLCVGAGWGVGALTVQIYLHAKNQRSLL